MMNSNWYSADELLGNLTKALGGETVKVSEEAE